MSSARKKGGSTRAGRSTSRFRNILCSLTALVSLGGLIETIYLTVAHLAGATVVCGGSSDCSTVLGSAYASVVGIPVAGLGAIGYFTTFSCATLAGFGYPQAQRVLAIIVGAMFAATLWLLVVQTFMLHTFCRYCLFSAALVFVLAALVIVMPAGREINADT